MSIVKGWTHREMSQLVVEKEFAVSVHTATKLQPKGANTVETRRQVG